MNKKIYILLLLTAICSSCSKDEFELNDGDASRNTTLKIAFSIPDSLYIINDTDLSTRGVAKIKRGDQSFPGISSYCMFEENNKFSLIRCTNGSQKMECTIGKKDNEMPYIYENFYNKDSYSNCYYSEVYEITKNTYGYGLVLNYFSLPEGKMIEGNDDYIAVYPFSAGTNDYNTISVECLKEQTCVANLDAAEYDKNYDYDIFVAKATPKTNTTFHNENGKESINDIASLELAFQRITTKYITTLSGIPLEESVEYVEYELMNASNTNYPLEWDTRYRARRKYLNNSNSYNLISNQTAIYKVKLKSSEVASSYGAHPISSGDFYNETKLVVAVTYLPFFGYYFDGNSIKVSAHTSSGKIYEGLLTGDLEFYGHHPNYSISNSGVWWMDNDPSNIYFNSKIMLKEKTNN